jgi:hypothetical protein
MVTYITFHKDKLISFWGALLILSKARGRHFSQVSLVLRTNLVNCLFKVWFILSTLPEEQGMSWSMIFPFEV